MCCYAPGMRTVALALLLTSCGGGSAAPAAWVSPTIPHPACEYVYRPGWIVPYLGADAWINSFHQRSPERSTVDVLVLGDSVVAAGNVAEGLTATALLEDATGLRVANIACDSWGPQNLLGYVQTFGTFGATRAFVVVSNHDAGDVLGEAWTALPTDVRPECVQALRDLLSLLRASGCVTTLLLHHERDHPEDRDGDAAFVALEPGLARLLLTPAGYADTIHLSAAGQGALAEQIGGLLDAP